MDRKNMIDAIYKKIADKTLLFWCIVWRYESEYDKELTIGTYISDYVQDEYTWKYRIKLFNWNIVKMDAEYEYDIIWHPISLARILHHLWEKSAKNYLTSYETTWMAKISTEYDDSFEWILIKDWTDAMLDDQSDNTIKTIYDLLFS